MSFLCWHDWLVGGGGEVSVCSVVYCCGLFVHYCCICWGLVGFVLRLCCFVVCSVFYGRMLVSYVLGIGCSVL